MAKRKMMKGNVAAAEAAVRAGVDIFAGYPITPSTEALEHLSYRMPQEGREFIQAENEIAAINMVMGAAATGARAMTASSGPGISLKQEGFSYIARHELPFVCMNVQRWGNGLGRLDSGQADYFRETRMGGNGDYKHIVYAPSTVQELVDMVYGAFDVAEKYRIGVMILSEAFLGQMMAPCLMPEYKKREKELGWGIDGTGKVGVKHSPDHRKQVKTLIEKVAIIEEEMQDYEAIATEDAEYVLVAFGLPGRVCIDAVKELRAKGEKVGVIRPKLVWPYPVNAFKEVNKDVKGFISVESNDLGQMVEDVALSAKKVFNRNVPIYCYPHSYGVPEVKVIVEKYYSIKDGKIEEVL
jgi:2-oxoglutarate ferredoxin oxidoreductase subunit alpha